MKNKKLGVIILIGLAARCILACITELNNDEAYYWTYAQKFQWNYFDHPPGIAVLLKIFTANLKYQQPLFLRLGSMVCAAISTWLIYLIGRKIKNDQTGLIAALLFTASPYCSLIAGWLVIPDAPQLVWWLASVLLMLRISDTAKHSKATKKMLLYLGITTGCCILCKVHGVFLWVGFLSYLVIFQRNLLRNPFLFYAGFICAVIISPVFFWNLSNDFISYRYHSERVSFFSTVQPDSFFRELIGEIIYNNPVIFVVMLLSLFAMVKKNPFVPMHQQRLLLLLALPMIALVWFMAVFRDTLPHWTGPAYTTLIPLAAAYLVSVYKFHTPKVIPSPVKGALLLTVLLIIVAIVIIKELPYNIGKKDMRHLGDGDPLLDISGFEKFGHQFDSLYKNDQQEGKIKNDAFLLSDFWFPAAHFDYYAARPNLMHFAAIGDLSSIHHYAWLNTIRPALVAGSDAYFITISNYFHPVPEILHHSFEHVSAPVVITQYRGGTPVRNFFIYRLTRYKGHLPANGVIN